MPLTPAPRRFLTFATTFLAALAASVQAAESPSPLKV